MTWETFLLKNHTQNRMDELFPESFLKYQNWASLFINSLKLYTVCFYYMPSWRLSKYIEAKLQTTCFYFIKSFFKKNKNLELVTYFHCLAAFTSWDNGLLTRLWRHTFWNIPYISNQAVSFTWPKSQDKNLNILRTKRAFKIK